MSEKVDKHPRLARRSMGARIEIKNDSVTDKEYFQNAVRFLWRYQWTKVYSPLTKPMTAELCKASMYNISILSALIMQLQSDAIINKKKDRITEKDIHETAEKNFGDVRRLIMSGEPDDRSVKSMIDVMKQKIRKKSDSMQEESLLSGLEEQVRIREEWGDTKYFDIESELRTEHGVSPERCKKAVMILVQKYPDLPKQDKDEIISMILDLVKADTDSNSVKVRKPRLKMMAIEDQSDIKSIINTEGVIK